MFSFVTDIPPAFEEDIRWALMHASEHPQVSGRSESLECLAMLFKYLHEHAHLLGLEHKRRKYVAYEAIARREYHKHHEEDIHSLFELVRVNLLLREDLLTTKQHLEQINTVLSDKGRDDINPVQRAASVDNDESVIRTNISLYSAFLRYYENEREHGFMYLCQAIRSLSGKRAADFPEWAVLLLGDGDITVSHQQHAQLVDLLATTIGAKGSLLEHAIIRMSEKRTGA